MSLNLAICALSGALKKEQLESYHLSLELLKEEGFLLELGDNLESSTEIFPGAEYFSAGSPEEKIKAFKKLNNSNPDLFYALKGGYGVQHCLNAFEGIELKTKSFFGYSDLTALFSFLYTLYQDQTNLFYSPMLCEYAELSKEEQDSLLYFMNNHNNLDLKKDLLNCTPGLESKLKEANSIFLEEPVFVWGGNLSLLVSENYILSGAKNILFIEDCDEEPYKIERAFISAFNQGFFDDINELWIGEAQATKYNYELIRSLAGDMNFNLIEDLPFGHKTKFTLPIFQQYN